MEFQQPEALYYVLTALAVVLILRRIKGSHYLAHSLAKCSFLDAFAPSPIRFLPLILMILGTLSLGLTLLDPQRTLQVAVDRPEGLQMVMVVDLSSSMLAFLGEGPGRSEWSLDRRDSREPVSRMEAVRASMITLLEGRSDDRVGLIVFSENSYVVAPLTRDLNYLHKYVRLIDPKILLGEGYTAVGEGIYAAIDLLGSQDSVPRRNQVIVVFTDGENNFGRDPIPALQLARRLGYRVYVIGVELEEYVMAKPNVRRLIQTVKETGGQYFDVRSPSSLARAASTINQLEKGVFVTIQQQRHVRLSYLFVYLSLGLIFAALALRSTPFFAEVN